MGPNSRLGQSQLCLTQWATPSMVPFAPILSHEVNHRCLMLRCKGPRLVMSPGSVTKSLRKSNLFRQCCHASGHKSDLFCSRDVQSALAIVLAQLER